jgi:hypothetical protein
MGWLIIQHQPKCVSVENKGASLFVQTVWEKEKGFITLTFCHYGLANNSTSTKMCFSLE